MSIIQDGAGGGSSTKVDASNRLHVRAISESEASHGTELGDSYNLISGLITLTTADESGVLYFKNKETQDFHVTAIILDLAPSTSGSSTDTTHAKIYKNPTTGTLISVAAAADINSNKNFGSSKTLSNSDVFKGTEGSTITNGSTHIEAILSPNTSKCISSFSVRERFI